MYNYVEILLWTVWKCRGWKKIVALLGRMGRVCMYVACGEASRRQHFVTFRLLIFLSELAFPFLSLPCFSYPILFSLLISNILQYITIPTQHLSSYRAIFVMGPLPLTFQFRRHCVLHSCYVSQKISYYITQKYISSKVLKLLSDWFNPVLIFHILLVELLQILFSKIFRQCFRRHLFSYWMIMWKNKILCIFS